MSLIIVLISATSALGFQEDSLSDLLVLMEARDTLTKSLRMRFTSSQVFDDGEKEGSVTWEAELTTGGPRHSVRGKRFQRKAGRNELVYSYHSTWNGVACEQLWEYPNSEPVVVISEKKDGSAFSAFMPTHFGMDSVMGPWPRLLKRYGAKQVGTEMVANKRCVIFQFDRSTRNGSPLIAPWRLWIDSDESLLVWKAIQYRKELPLDVRHSEKYDPKAMIVHILDGKPFYVDLEWTLDVSTQVGNVWVPVSGILAPRLRPHLGRIKTEVDISSVKLDVQWDNGEFHVPKRSNTQVFDRIRERNTIVEPGSGERHMLAIRTERLVQRVAQELKLGDRGGVSDSLEDFRQASCGHKAMFLYNKLFGSGASLRSWISKVQDSESGTSLGQLASASELLGSPLVPVLAEVKDPTLLKGPFVAHLRTDHLDAEGKHELHYVVAWQTPEGMRLALPPDYYDTMAISEFVKHWTGWALAPRAVLGANALTGVGVYAGVSVIVASLVMFWLRAKRGRKVVAPLTLMISCTLLSCGDNTTSRDVHTPSPSSTPSADSRAGKDADSETMDFGTVDAGTVIPLTSKFTNATKRKLLLGTHHSCGASTPSLSKPVLNPGETCDIVIAHDTNGKSGSVTEFIEIKDGEQLLKTIWLIGKVIGAAQLRASVDEISLGPLSLGSAPSVQFTVDAVFTGERTLRIAGYDNHKDDVINWVVTAGQSSEDIVGNRRRISQVLTASFNAKGIGDLSGKGIVVVALDSDGRSLGTVRVPLFGSVAGAVDCSPSLVYCGIVSRGEVIQRSLKVALKDGKPLSSIQFRAEGNWLSLVPSSMEGGIVNLSVSVDTSTVSEGAFQGRIVVLSDGVEVQACRVVGKVRE